jgi:hypothetical protein
MKISKRFYAYLFLMFLGPTWALKVATLIHKVLPQQKPVSIAAKPFKTVLLFSRQVFLVQDGPRKKLKISSELPRSELTEYIC